MACGWAHTPPCRAPRAPRPSRAPPTCGTPCRRGRPVRGPRGAAEQQGLTHSREPPSFQLHLSDFVTAVWSLKYHSAQLKRNMRSAAEKWTSVRYPCLAMECTVLASSRARNCLSRAKSRARRNNPWKSSSAVSSPAVLVPMRPRRLNAVLTLTVFRSSRLSPVPRALRYSSSSK